MLPDDVIVSRAAKLGVSLGSSYNQVNESISILEYTDMTRNLFMLKRN
jgi:hypothetical protein